MPCSSGSKVNEELLLSSLRRIGDCDAPAIIAAAVYSGHRYARELNAKPDPDIPLRIKGVLLNDGLTDAKRR